MVAQFCGYCHILRVCCVLIAWREAKAFSTGWQALSGSEEVAWNYVEFEVHYHTLDNEIKIGMHGMVAYPLLTTLAGQRRYPPAF
jgi:hypothetical protein